MANNKTVSISANGYRVRASNSLFTFFSGHLMLLSRDKMEPVWDQLAELDGFQLQPMLPSTSPLLVLNRRIQSTSSSKPQDQVKPSFVGSGLQVISFGHERWACRRERDCGTDRINSFYFADR